jgi:hypothetical protein
LLALLLLAGGVFVLRAVPRGGAATAVVRTAKGEVARVLLIPDVPPQVLEPCPGLRLEFRSGRVRFAASPCRDQLCVREGWLSKAGESALCLPERVLVTVVSRKGSGVDAVAG